MAVGFPTKVDYNTGDVLSAQNMNDLSGTVNLLTGTQQAAGKNPVLNSSFNVWQRGTSISLAASSGLAYTADRWQTQTNANQASTISRQLTNDTTNLPNIQYCMRYQRNSGQTGATRQYIVNSFETINTIPFVGKTVTLSYYARAGANYSAASSIFQASLFTGTGTDQSAFLYTGSAQIGSTNATLTTTWQRFSLTVAIPTTVTELAPTFSWVPVGTAGANDYFEVTGVQLEASTVASAYAPNGSTYQAELAACQRYYFRQTAAEIYSVFGVGLASGTTGAKILCPFPVTMRTKPSSVDFSTLALWDTISTPAITSLTLSESNTTYTNVSAVVASGLTLYRTYMILANGSTSAYLGFSAEL
jgi:hypothetical protein